MPNQLSLKTILMLGSAVAAIALVGSAAAQEFAVPSGDLKHALEVYRAQTGVALVVSSEAIKGVRSAGAKGDLSPDSALFRILSGTGFTAHRDPSGIVAVVRENSSSLDVQPMQLAQAAPPRAAVETVTVTSSKLGGADVQSIPIAITALSQEQLTATQTAGGPDLVKQVPNLTFSKTNFSGYNLQIRGIGTQAISVTTDPAVAVAFNDTPFIRNHFFEQEFFDVAQVEVLRGPQGTLYGRNATAGVVNVTSTKPTDQFEAMASADVGNFKNRRFEGMINIPFDTDKLDLRIAGEWTKRDGYSFNEITDSQIDGRDLWSGRATLGWKPTSTIQTYFIWEHFQEDDDRLRTSKQLCKTDPGPTTLTAADGSGIPVPPSGNTTFSINAANFSQACLPDSLYDKGDPAHGDYGNFGVPNGYALPFVSGIGYTGHLNLGVDPYSAIHQSTNLRNIQSTIDPTYKAKNDTLEFNANWNISPALTFYSDTGYNRDFLWSTEDFNRFDTSPGIFAYGNGFSPDYATLDPNFPPNNSTVPPYPGAMIICDPQLGCSNRLVVEDLSTETAWQASQEFRLASNLAGPFNFSIGANYLHYETTEKYYVFANSFSLFTLVNCTNATFHLHESYVGCLPNGKSYIAPESGSSVLGVHYTDSNPLTSLDDQGHNYFLSRNPYNLNSYAAFGEAYYNVTNELKLTAGLRWTDDQKHFTNYPSELLATGYGYASTGIVDQEWNEWTGRAVANWSPKLSFTDQSMFYASYSHGYKAGGANPPGAVLLTYSPSTNSTIADSHSIPFPVHPFTFEPEFINAYELGTKNTLFDGALTLNGDAFFYDYKGYQISQIVDRTSVNLNFDATVRGAELEATWEPVPGLKFSFGGGYEATRINNGQSAIDLMDRTAGHPGWLLMRPFVGQSSNCIFPEYVAAAILQTYLNGGEGNSGPFACGIAYYGGQDPVTQAPYSGTTYPITIPGETINGIPVPPMSYPGYDPLSVDPTVDPKTVNQGLGLPPNNGEGFAKNVGGNELPNAPHFTLTLGADYTLPVTPDWAMTLHSDFYWQADSWARVFNDNPYDRIQGYTNVNLALILTDTSGWQIMGYVKNVFDTTAITGDFLNSDDSGLTTNVFLTDPRLFGVRVTKHFDGGSLGGTGLNFLDGDRRPQLWVQLGGNYAVLSADNEKYVPLFESVMPDGLPKLSQLEKSPSAVFDWEGKFAFQPEDSDWVLKAGVRYGRSTKRKVSHVSLPPETRDAISNGFFGYNCTAVPTYAYKACKFAPYNEFEDSSVSESETHEMIDFTLGKDVGLGLFGHNGDGTLAVGVRIAQLASRTTASINTDPFYYFPENVFTPGTKYHDVYNATTEERRDFHGVGPEATWDASIPVLGEPDSGQVTFDWGMNAAVLLGEQTAQVKHTATDTHCTSWFSGAEDCAPAYSPEVKTETFKRSRHVTVPNLGGYIGASVRYHNSKISLGYRADTFFNAMDGGQETAKSYNRGFYGPYLNVSLGL